MIPTLLWRCPLCAVNDALIERRRLFRPLQVQCTHCATIWEARRVIGDDYWLRVASCPSNAADQGTDLPLAEWYARMKETVVLTPISDPSLELADDEPLYLASAEVSLSAERDDPLFHGGAAGVRPDPGRLDSAPVGEGRLYLTANRLIWHGEDGRRQDLALARLSSAYTIYNRYLVLLYGMRLYRLRFKQESLLKWLTYLTHVAREVEQTTGHVIGTSNL
jgi:hypothetical protein